MGSGSTRHFRAGAPWRKQFVVCMFLCSPLGGSLVLHPCHKLKRVDIDRQQCVMYAVLGDRTQRGGRGGAVSVTRDTVRSRIGEQLGAEVQTPLPRAAVGTAAQSKAVERR